MKTTKPEVTSPSKIYLSGKCYFIYLVCSLFQWSSFDCSHESFHDKYIMAFWNKCEYMSTEIMTDFPGTLLKRTILAVDSKCSRKTSLTFWRHAMFVSTERHPKLHLVQLGSKSIIRDMSKDPVWFLWDCYTIDTYIDFVIQAFWLFVRSGI